MLYLDKFKWYLNPLAEREDGLNRSKKRNFHPELLTLNGV